MLQRAIFATTDPHAAYLHFLTRARALDPETLEASNIDPDIARSNARRGAESVRARIDEVREVLPRLDIEFALELPALALAFTYAVDRVGTPDVAPPVADDSLDALPIAERLRRLRKPRKLALDQLGILSEMFPRVVSPDTVAAIRKGTGSLDNARDAVSLVAIYREKREDLAGKHPFSDAWLETLSALGQSLLHSLNPTGAVVAAAPRSEAAVLRDAFWKLMQDAHSLLRKAAFVLWDEKLVDEYVPSLHARVFVAAPLKPVA